VLDLRADGGGYLPEATALTGLFIDHGPVVQLRDNSGRTEVLDDPEPAPAYDGPLAVLVDRYSASASEIFAGAIQDYHRGVILGQTTFGKGTVQNLVPLDRWSQKPVNGQLTVTIGKFYRVTGESTQHRGVQPDVPLASALDTKEVGESALESALPWDRISGVPFRTSAAAASAPPVAALANEENARAQRDPDYRWLMSDIAAIDSVRGQHSVSLNLKARREERARIEKERLERENSRRVAKNLAPLKSIEELDKTKDESADVVLDQATQVMADIVTGARPQQPPQKTARSG
jgi:carboxyl-terminal processing protease